MKSLADFEGLGGAAPIPHCVPMTDYPVPQSARRWLETFRSRELRCRADWSPSRDNEVMQQTLAMMPSASASSSAPTRWSGPRPSASFHSARLAKAS